MSKKDKNYKDTFVGADRSVVDALRIIDNSTLQIALVVDADHKLLGTVTDGDIRRAILANMSLDSPVTQVMNKIPITVTPQTDLQKILEIMRERKIYQVPVLDKQGRVIGLERMRNLLDHQQEKQEHSAEIHTLETRREQVPVMLMLGGEGKRLHPLTQDTPKPMLTVGDKPLLETIVRNFAAQGFRKFHFSVNYKSEIIRAYFGDGSKFGVNISYIEETTPMGTAGSLSMLPEKPKSPVVVMNGDLLTTVNFGHLLAFHRQNKVLATMGVREYNIEVPYGIIENEGTRFDGITEKPMHSYFVNAGIYVLNPEALAMIPKNVFFDMPQLFEKIRSSGAESAVFPIHEYWLDIGRLEDLERARAEYAQVFGT